MRREFPARVRFAALKRCSDERGIPRCEAKDCGKELKAGDLFYDHDMPDGLGGEPTLENCRVLCRAHHDHKTHKEDNPRMQKADRVRKKHFGITGPKRKIPSRPFRRQA